MQREEKAVVLEQRNTHVVQNEVIKLCFGRLDLLQDRGDALLEIQRFLEYFKVVRKGVTVQGVYLLQVGYLNEEAGSFNRQRSVHFPLLV